MENKYVYKDQDITIDVLMKIEDVVNKIAQKESKQFDEVYLNFLDSKTYRALQNTNSLLWQESAEFIIDDYYRERAKGPIP
jgi:ssRNA-specific RNase YbeY (16S rRNA maturation enzyme)